MDQNSDLQSNGNSLFKNFGETKKVTTVPSFWRRFEINEWSFSLLLFIFSLLIVIGKLAINYGIINQQWTLIDRILKQNINNSYQFSELDSEKLEKYRKSINRLYETHGWLLKAALSGLATMSFTWFIIYEDSNVPGVEPPSPLHNARDRFKKQIGIPINYFVGLLNGLLIFFYMCI